MAININGTSGISGVDGTAGTPALQGSDTNTGISFGADTININTGGTTRATVDSSGRMLVGTSSGTDANSGADNLIIGTSSTSTAGITINTGAGSYIGRINFGRGATNKDYGYLVCDHSNGFMSFGVGSTERMRIQSDGYVNIGNPTRNLAATGISLNGTNDADSYFVVSTASSVLALNRQGSDGDLIRFFQASAQEGVISVSGSTVTYGGGHLARWSQLPNDEDPSTLLKGTVMSNLDEMCKWDEEANEQLNKTKVSNIEGDLNVAGVFVATSPSEDGPLDFFVGMTGDMIIRIAEGVTVERGDLLMSAGDGTAKPQDDDIIRSKTIAKVTSTNVSCTYDDGSYCVPCVLMAC